MKHRALVYLFVCFSLSPVFAQTWTPNNTTATTTGKVMVGSGSEAHDRMSIAGGSGFINLGSNFAGYNGIWLNNSTVANEFNILSSGTDKNLYVNRPTGWGIHFREFNGATAQMVIAPNGLVGIGTNVPEVALHIKGPGHLYQIIERPSASVDGALIFRTGAGAQWSFGKLTGVLGAPDESLHLSYGTSLNTARVTFEPAGDVGINTPLPNAPLEITGRTTNSIAKMLMLSSPLTSGNAAGDGTAIVFTANNRAREASIAGVGEAYNNEQALAFSTQSTAGGLTERMRISGVGNVGVGTNNPSSRLHVGNVGATAANVEALVANSFTTHQARLTLSSARNWSVAADNTTGAGALRVVDNTGGATRMSIDAAGNVGIGVTNPAYKLHVDGTIYATQVIGAVFQDVAEWVPATEDMPPGTVVVLSGINNNEVAPSAEPYDTRVAGVVSAQPGLILGVAADDKEQIATTGRVKVRVDATEHAITIGDLLVTSTKPGAAMKSLPMEINGRKFHQPGTIVGKALEPLAGGVGEILVLLSMQ